MVLKRLIALHGYIFFKTLRKAITYLRSVVRAVEFCSPQFYPCSVFHTGVGSGRTVNTLIFDA